MNFLKTLHTHNTDVIQKPGNMSPVMNIIGILEPLGVTYTRNSCTQYKNWLLSRTIEICFSSVRTSFSLTCPMGKAVHSASKVTRWRIKRCDQYSRGTWVSVRVHRYPGAQPAPHQASPPMATFVGITQWSDFQIHFNTPANGHAICYE